MTNRIQVVIHRCINSKYTIFWILGLGLLLRLIVIRQSLWLDEAIGAIAAKNYSYRGIITLFIHNDNHPPLYYLLLKLWTSLIGFSEPALRSLSVAFGLGTIYLTYKIAEKLTNNAYFKFLAAILITTSQFHIYYSQEARMYSMAAFFASSCIYLYLFLISSKKIPIGIWIAFSISLTLFIFTDYVPVFLLPFFIMHPLFIAGKNKNWWLNYGLAYLPLVVLGLIWLPTFFLQSAGGRWLLETLPDWRSVAGGATVKQAILVWTKFVGGRISFRNKIIYGVLISLYSIPIIISLIRALVTRSKVLIIWLWLIIPLVLGYLVSYLFPAFIYFRFVYVIPAFYILIAWGIINIRSSSFKLLVASLIIFFNLFSWSIYISDKNQQREQWRQAVNYIETKARVNEVAVFEFPEPFAPYKWYTNGSVESAGVTDSISADPKLTKSKIEGVVMNKSGVFYFEYLRDLSDPQRVVEQALAGNGFKVRNVENFVGVGQVFYYTK